jgi:hypothetical protein
VPTVGTLVTVVHGRAPLQTPALLLALEAESPSAPMAPTESIRVMGALGAATMIPQAAGMRITRRTAILQVPSSRTKRSR